MYAVIKTGGKQYRVAPNDTLQIEKLIGAAGDSVEFTDVLMIADGAEVQVGAPLLSGVTVAGEIVAQERGPRIIIFKKKRRHHYRRRNGHRQDLTAVKITEILTGGAKPAAKAKEPTAEAVAAPIAPADKADDLSLIAGIGPKINKGLTDIGYTTYAQIAALSSDEIEKIEDGLKIKGRVARDEWVEQAKELMDGKPPRAKIDKAKQAETKETE